MEANNMYAVLFLVGLIGVFALALVGAHHTSGGHHVGHGSGATGGHGSAGHGHGLLTISLIDLFSVSFAAGGAGLLLSTRLEPMWLAVVALAAGLAFDLVAVRPMTRILGRFASQPCEGLEGAIAKPAEAITGFDANGRGLVRLNLDGHTVQLLATLDSLDIERGARVSRGDQVLVVGVDPARNACRVTRELAP